MNIEELKKKIKNPNIEILRFREHSKASEKYIDVVFSYPEQKVKWGGSIPYYYRRTGTFIESNEELAALIDKAYEAVNPKNSLQWIKTELQLWKKEYTNKKITKPFFEALASMQWTCVEHGLPRNPNWARRIQDIKEMGYSLATNTSMACRRCKKNSTHLLLVPLEKGAQTGYEIFSPKLKKRIINVLGGYNAFEGRPTNPASLIPDHKFPEISWDENTREENPDDMTDEQIKAKFQLLDNQRNLEKREACRKVFQTGKRGTLFGIKYYYEGNEDWPKDVPRVGKEAERGWIGTPWYDIEKWRDALNKDIERWKKIEKDYLKMMRDKKFKK